jgi:cytochrome P450 monooxygenase
MGSFFARTLGSCVGVQNGAEWKNTRSHLDPHFSFTSANSVVATTKSAIKTWAETLPREVNTGVSGPFELDAIVACRQLPFRLIAMALYGEVFSEEVSLKPYFRNSTSTTDRLIFPSYLGDFGT